MIIKVNFWFSGCFEAVNSALCWSDEASTGSQRPSVFIFSPLETITSTDHFRAFFSICFISYMDILVCIFLMFKQTLQQLIHRLLKSFCFYISAQSKFSQVMMQFLHTDKHRQQKRNPHIILLIIHLYY